MIFNLSIRLHPSIVSIDGDIDYSPISPENCTMGMLPSVTVRRLGLDADHWPL